MHGLLGYLPGDLLETSLFDCQHGADSERLMATFKSGKFRQHPGRNLRFS